MAAPMSKVFNFKFIVEKKKPPAKPPKKKNPIMYTRNLMVALILFLFSFVIRKSNCDSSIPKSVNNPVKCVVLTTAFEIFVT